MTEPAIRRKFLQNNLGGNHNKWWMVEWWEDGRYVTTYGRVGDPGTPSEKTGISRHYVEKKIADKLNPANYDDGIAYTELDLDVPALRATTPTKQANVVTLRSPNVERMVESIFREANEHIKSYLAVGVDALSQRQIALGRAILNQIGNADPAHYGIQEWADYKRAEVQRFYNTIPTVMDRRPDISRLVSDFDPEKQEDRLNQLEAALSTYQATQAAPTGTSQYDLLGAKLEWLDPNYSVIAKTVKAQFEKTANGNHVTGIYTVEIPSERAAFERETFGDHKHELLWHGTKAQNVRHILKTGFKIPDFFSNGWMFGPGIYLADESRKSQGYASARYGDTMMLLCEAKLGDGFVAKDAQSFKVAPPPYHHVMGKAGYTKSWGSSTLHMNEYILYRPSQVTIRYIITYR